MTINSTTNSTSNSHSNSGNESLLARLVSKNASHSLLDITLFLPTNYKDFELLNSLFKQKKANIQYGLHTFLSCGSTNDLKFHQRMREEYLREHIPKSGKNDEIWNENRRVYVSGSHASPTVKYSTRSDTSNKISHEKNDKYNGTSSGARNTISHVSIDGNISTNNAAHNGVGDTPKDSTYSTGKSANWIAENDSNFASLEASSSALDVPSLTISQSFEHGDDLIDQGNADSNNALAQDIIPISSKDIVVHPVSSHNTLKVDFQSKRFIFPCNINLYRIPSRLHHMKIGSVIWCNWDFKIDGIEGFPSFFSNCMSTLDKVYEGNDHLNGQQAEQGVKNKSENQIIHVLLSFTNVDYLAECISQFSPEIKTKEMRDINMNYASFFFRNARKMLHQEKEKRNLASVALISVESESSNLNIFRECFEYYDFGKIVSSEKKITSPFEEMFIPPNSDTLEQIVQVDIHHLLGESGKVPSFQEVFKKDEVRKPDVTLFDLNEFLASMYAKKEVKTLSKQDNIRSLKRNLSSSVLLSTEKKQGYHEFRKSLSRSTLTTDGNTSRTTSGNGEAESFFTKLLRKSSQKS